MKQTKHTPETCTECGESLNNPKKIKWLSQTDGYYYANLPAMHTSQGAFPFGTSCATKKIKETTTFLNESRIKRLSVFTHCLIDLDGRGFDRIHFDNVDYYTEQLKNQGLSGKIMPFEVAFNALETAAERDRLKEELKNEKEFSAKTIRDYNTHLERANEQEYKADKLEEKVRQLTIRHESDESALQSVYDRNHLQAKEISQLKEENERLKLESAIRLETIKQANDFNRELLEALKEMYMDVYGGNSKTVEEAILRSPKTRSDFEQKIISLIQKAS